MTAGFDEDSRVDGDRPRIQVGRLDLADLCRFPCPEPCNVGAHCFFSFEMLDLRPERFLDTL